MKIRECIQFIWARNLSLVRPETISVNGQAFTFIVT